MSRFSPVPRQKLIKFLLENGFVEARKTGKHMTFSKKGIARPITISHGSKYKDIPVDIVKKIFKIANLSLEDLNRFLGRG